MILWLDMWKKQFLKFFALCNRTSSFEWNFDGKKGLGTLQVNTTITYNMVLPQCHKTPYQNNLVNAHMLMFVLYTTYESHVSYWARLPLIILSWREYVTDLSSSLETLATKNTHDHLFKKNPPTIASLYLNTL